MRKNHELAAATLAHIQANMADWSQFSYRTCFAGHALRLSGYTLTEVNPGITVFYDPSGRIVENGLVEAAAELGFTAEEGRDVFLFFPPFEMTTLEAFAELELRVLTALASDNDTDFAE